MNVDELVAELRRVTGQVMNDHCPECRCWNEDCCGDSCAIINKAADALENKQREIDALRIALYRRSDDADKLASELEKQNERVWKLEKQVSELTVENINLSHQAEKL